MIRFEIEYHTVWGENLVLEMPERDFPMNYGPGGLWSVEIDAPLLKGLRPLEYRYKVVKDGILSRVEWRWHEFRAVESSLLRDSWIEKPSGSNVFQNEHSFKAFDKQGYRGAGVAVPLFSLRSVDGFGTGEFPDLKLLAAWASGCGMSIIQLLPLNDTTQSGTRDDSSPYNAVSAFALHPQFINIAQAWSFCSSCTASAGNFEDTGWSSEYAGQQRELNELSQVDYEKVNEAKIKFLKRIYAAMGKRVLGTESYRKFFEDNESWLLPYAVFCSLRDACGTADFNRWESLSRYSSAKAAKYAKANKTSVDFHCFVQYIAHLQFKEAVEYAHSKGVAIKGDLPIGVSRCSVDAWCHPELFNMDSQCGAPPDDFSLEGQNWNFPTYNWEAMAKDNYAWWKARLRKMSEYFDAFRIDHILGFFRIWEIPACESSALKGHFSPALPFSTRELSDIITPFYSDGLTKRNAAESFRTLLKELFVKDPHRRGFWHPRIALQRCETFESLSEGLRKRLKELYNDYFYRRHNDFWKYQALLKLPELIYSSGMLACGEDLGMLADSVPQVMKQLNLLSLEVQRMPKTAFREFDRPCEYPYLSVCTTSTHDMPPLRLWWAELAPEKRERYLHGLLLADEPVCSGVIADKDCSAELCKRIVAQHLASPSMLCILPLQDWFSIDERIRAADPSKERINDPADSGNCWCYRMHIALENLLSHKDFTEKILELLSDIKPNMQIIS